MYDPEEVVKQWIETIWNQGKLEQLDRFQPSTISNNDAPFTLDDTRSWHERSRQTFSDLHYEVEDLFSAQDKVVVRWRASGAHDGTLWGLIPPTHKRVSWRGMHIVGVEHGKIIEVWSVADQAPMLQEMGAKLLPPDAK
ncbi:MAG: ester cyclase [Candidatus Methanoperedens sp.]|nr:ester cyclase [Candidatus Methanoperedens sp.]